MSAPLTAPRRPRRLCAALPFAAAAALLTVLTGCSSTPPAASAAAGSSSATSGAASASPSTPKQPVVRVDGTASAVSYLSPVKLVVDDGSFTSVQVSAVQTGQELDGGVSGDGTSWQSQSPPKPAASYRVVATVKDAAGQTLTQNVSFGVAAVPNDQRLSFSVTPQDGSTVGIGQPIVVRFLSTVTQRAAVEKVMTVDAKTPSGQPVAGSWHWLSGQEVHWRPKDFWAPGTKVTLDLKIAGVKAAANRYGRKDYSQTFTIGASHITRYDATSKVLRVFRDGRLIDSWPSGSGRPGLETYSGTYVVLGKAPVVKMDSCSARITCDKKNPDYYDEKEYWATRLTASGTFIHAADWDPLLGRSNVSHGCIHLSGTNAKDYYNHAVPGDVVIVTRTGRGPQERINTQDPGLYDWNVAWTAWTAGSALS